MHLDVLRKHDGTIQIGDVRIESSSEEESTPQKKEPDIKKPVYVEIGDINLDNFNITYKQEDLEAKLSFDQVVISPRNISGGNYTSIAVNLSLIHI